MSSVQLSSAAVSMFRGTKQDNARPRFPDRVLTFVDTDDVQPLLWSVRPLSPIALPSRQHILYVSPIENSWSWVVERYCCPLSPVTAIECGNNSKWHAMSFLYQPSKPNSNRCLTRHVRKFDLSEKLLKRCYFGPYRVERIVTNDTEKLPSNSPAGATYNVGTDKRDTTLDSPG
ncbi:hypothetical protein TNCV_3410841 [Trichonephila clavipes]|nr:hypothetical protein TNCV_3410841 [Trichonephila clavipes]